MMNIEKFKAHFLGGARANRFVVEVPNLPEKAQFLFKSTSLPGENIGEVLFQYQGATAKFAGDRTYNDWQVTMIIDDDYAGERELRAWNELIREKDTGKGLSNHNQYKKDCFVTHYSVDGSVIAQYKLFGAFPKVIDDNPVSWDTTDTAMELSITFAYDYHKRIA